MTAAFVFTACGAPTIEDVGGVPELTVPAVTTTVTEATKPPVPQDTVIHFTAAGDNLIHSSIYNQAQRRSEDGTYDFDFAYDNIRGLICGDINLLNQETPIANDIFEPSTYPCFNSPTQLGDTMLDLGFDVFNHANNHILDRGAKGTNATLDYWASKKGATVCGVYRNEEDMANIRTVERDGVVFSFLGFTEHTNGIKLPEDSELQVIYTSETDKIQSQIEAAAEISDFVVVSVHWGVENSHNVTDAQRNLAKSMADWGADLIVGTHPHVLQTLEWVEADDGRRVLTAYSLGNFISAQDVGNRMIGGVLDLNVRKDGATGKLFIESPKLIPVITHYDYGFSNVRVYPFKDYTAELASSHGVRQNSHFDYDFIMKTLTEIIPEEFLKLD